MAKFNQFILLTAFAHQIIAITLLKTLTLCPQILNVQDIK